MTVKEFSDEFDILYNNISSNQAPGLDEYEKSVFLTQAQESLIIDLYRGALGDSFESTEEITSYLESLVLSSGSYTSETGSEILGCKRFTLTLEEDDILFIVFETSKIVLDSTNTERDVLVKRVTHDTLAKDLRNPFRKPNMNKVLCTFENSNIVLYTSKDVDSVTYKMKYIAIPNPIILTDLNSISSDLSIRGENTEMGCELHPALHMPILTRAVQMAKASMGIIETQN